MLTPSTLFSHAAPVFQVSDMEQAIIFYRDKLGFTVSYTWMDPPEYVVLKGGEGVSLHLSLEKGKLPSQMSNYYIFVHDVEALYAHYVSLNLDIHREIGSQEYKMKDFDILDPDGNRLVFGQGES